MRGLFKRLINHISIVFLLIALQIGLFIWMVDYAATYWQWNIVFLSLSAISVLTLITRHENPAYKLLWIIPILLFPVFGGAFYLFYRQRNYSPKQIKRHLLIENGRLQYIQKFKPALVTKEANYLLHQNWMSFQATKTDFLSSGEIMFERLLDDIKQAKRFILLDFFIIKKGYMWETILKSLQMRVQAGVEVIIIYDDLGSVGLPFHYPEELLQVYGIKAYKFNRLRLHINFANNFRSHRKVIVIDGQIGYATGNNIGDEYINRIQKFGHWNDAGVRLDGRAVWSLTLTFLNTLEFITGEKLHYWKYLIDYDKEDDGYVIPFSETPLDDEATTKNVYLSLIYAAKTNIQITTPYLIIDHEFENALQVAAKSGVNVEIIIPKIPDKKLVYMVTESNLPKLIKSGVKVYRYTPGFIHSKMMIVDYKTAMIGTANLDYRSLYLHFENTVFLDQTQCIKDMQDYFEKTKSVSALVPSNEKRGIIYRIIQVFLRMFSGLL